jgi:ribosomal protein S18 acetylase RimI-like enzyme
MAISAEAKTSARTLGTFACMAGTIRAATPEDTDAIVEVGVRAWAPVFRSFAEVWGPELYARIHPNWEVEQAASIRTAVGDNPTWVTADGSRVTGFVNVTFDEAEQIGEIYMVAVDPDHQGEGLASQLTQHALAEMRARGMTLAVVGTGGDPGHAPARATYEKAGFKPFPQTYYAKLLDPPEG